MNKIFFLKILVTFMTVLIFLGLGGVVYGIAFYKKTPKLVSGKILAAAETSDIWLGQESGSKINDVTGCGAYLCVRVATDTEAEKIAVVDPAARKVAAWIRVGKAPEKAKKQPEKK